MNWMIVTMLFLLTTILAFAEGGGQGGLLQHYGGRPPGSLYDDTYANYSGRENKAAAAQGTGNQGQQAANSAGAALTAAGIPMTMSPILPVRIMGYTLLAMAAKEFQQAGADGSSADKNGDQSTLLRSEYGQSGSQAKATSGPDPKDQILTPQLRETLEKRGINPDEWARRLLNNEFPTTADIARAAGEGEVSREDLARGEALAQAEAGKILPSTAFQYSESGNAKDHSVVAGGDSLSSGGSSASNSSSLNEADKRPDSDGRVVSANLGTAGSEGQSAGLNANSSLLDGMLKGMGLQGDEDEEKRVAAINAYLQSREILMANPGQNIFQLAHHHYRSYNKWRKQSRLAMN